MSINNVRIINNIVLHCTATQPNAKISAIQKFWRTPKPKGNGWKSPGYHYIITADGDAVQLLSEEQVSNGVAGHNSDSIHVCYIGGIDKQGKPTDTRTPEQIKAMKELVTELRNRYPRAKILGHRDFGVPKACPSFDVASWLKSVNIK